MKYFSVKSTSLQAHLTDICTLLLEYVAMCIDLGGKGTGWKDTRKLVVTIGWSSGYICSISVNSLNETFAPFYIFSEG